MLSLNISRLIAENVSDTAQGTGMGWCSCTTCTDQVVYQKSKLHWRQPPGGLQYFSVWLVTASCDCTWRGMGWWLCHRVSAVLWITEAILTHRVWHGLTGWSDFSVNILARSWNLGPCWQVGCVALCHRRKSNKLERLLAAVIVGLIAQLQCQNSATCGNLWQ